MLKKFLSPTLIDRKLNVSLLILRAFAAIVMIPHGYQKLLHYSENASEFMNFMGLGGEISYALIICAEFSCAILLLVGLFTRFASIPLIIAMAVAVCKAHNCEIFGDGQTAFLFLTCFLTVMIAGPGKYSIDAFLFPKK